MAQFFLWIVKGFGWVLLLVAFLVLLLLVFPLWVAVEVHYDRLTVKIHVLGLAIPVYPLPKKKKKYRPKHLKEKTPQPEESADLPKGEEGSSEAPPPKEEKADTEQGERGKSGWWSPGRVFEIITTSGKLMRAFLRVIRIKKVQLVLPIAAEDAAQTAIQYGKMQAAVGSALGVLQNYFEIQISNEDPTSGAGRQTMILVDCNIDGGVLAKFDADGEYLDEDMDFTFEDFKMPEAFKDLEGFLTN